MTKPTLVIMAAGIGSRYGGLKQIDPVGPNGEIIMDYSIYDAVKAGFDKVVFIIKKEMEDIFREKVGSRIDAVVKTSYVFQSVDDVPAGFEVPEGRVKPWGTGHAVLSCRNAVDSPFAVINADDFYGQTSFQMMNDYLVGMKDSSGMYQYCMVGFKLENTLTEHGHVARGVCTLDSSGNLKEIHERTKIQKFGNATKYTEDDKEWILIPQGSIVSMNIWGFTPSVFSELEAGFPSFLRDRTGNILKAEYFLPSVIDGLISGNKAQVKVLPSKERWYGVTYQEDKPQVKEAIFKMTKEGIYPENLWGYSK